MGWLDEVSHTIDCHFRLFLIFGFSVLLFPTLLYLFGSKRTSPAQYIELLYPIPASPHYQVSSHAEIAFLVKTELLVPLDLHALACPQRSECSHHMG